MTHALNLVGEDIARQVKRHRDKRRGPRAGSGADTGLGVTAAQQAM
jgi:hypothetical protein